jgi:hypothetical protein
MLGKDYGKRTTFTKNIIHQHLWGRDFDPLQEKWSPYKGVYGRRYGKSFFLADHFGFDPSVQEDQGPASLL